MTDTPHITGAEAAQMLHASEDELRVGLAAMAPNALGEIRNPEDLTPAAETRMPFDEA